MKRLFPSTSLDNDLNKQQDPSFSRSFLIERLHFVVYLLLSLLSLIGCGSEADRRSALKSCSTQQSHPSSDFMVEAGIGPSIEKARERASAELSRRISAELRSLVTVKSQQKDGSVKEEVEEEIEVSARFKHAELIKSIKRCERCSGKICQTSVALSRDEVADRLLKEIEADAQILAQSTQDLTSKAELISFTQAWRVAHAAYQRMTPQLNQLRVIQRTTQPLRDAIKVMGQASKERAKRQRRLWIDLKPLELKPTAPEALGEALSHALTTSFKKIGLKRWDQKGCPTSVDQAADVLQLTPRGDLNCSLGLVGPQCVLSLSVHVDLCREGEARELTQAEWSDARIVGVHPRDKQEAIQLLTRSLHELDLSSHLTRTLSPIILL